MIELLVVIATLMILVGILLPALGGAQTSARGVVCASNQRQLILGLLRYASVQNEWIPGYNTSGRSLWWRPDDRAIQALSRYQNAPVQVNDWISPSIGEEHHFSKDRNERFYSILEEMACPSMAERVPVWRGSGAGGPELSDWIEEKKSLPARGISYLMPANFQLFGGDQLDPLIGQRSSGKLMELRRIHWLNPAYQPRVDQVGSLSRKAALADGFRYIDATLRDFDAAYSHQNWGSFTERSPCDVGSRAWGAKGGGGTGFNIPLSYRHRGKMGIAFWDGHVEHLTIHESKNPVFWAPTGSKVMPAMRNEAASLTFGYDPMDRTRNTIE